MDNFVNKMLTFLAVVEEQSFAKAAKKLFITPAAVSKHIKQLETRLEHQLLERNTRYVKVTELGKEFYDYCVKLRTNIVSAEAFMESQHHVLQGKLSILSSLHFADTFLIKHLQEFHELYPRLELYIDIAERYPNLQADNFDIVIGFRSYAPTAEQLRQRKLYTDRLILCASQDYLKCHEKPKAIKDLIHHKWLVHSLHDPHHLVRFKNGTEILPEQTDVSINSMPALIELCRQGAGIFMAHHLLVKDLINSGELVEVLPEYPLADFAVYAFYRPMRHEQKKVRCFIDFYLKKISKENK